jgi:hypothetical protein
MQTHCPGVEQNGRYMIFTANCQGIEPLHGLLVNIIGKGKPSDCVRKAHQPSHFNFTQLLMQVNNPLLLLVLRLSDVKTYHSCRSRLLYQSFSPHGITFTDTTHHTAYVNQFLHNIVPRVKPQDLKEHPSFLREQISCSVFHVNII